MKGGPVVISISPGTILVAVGIVLGVWLLFYLKALVLIVLAAIVIASAVQPGIRWFTDRRLSRTLAVSIIYAVIVAVFFGPLYFLLPLLLDEAIGFLSTMSQYLNTFNIQSILPPELLSSTQEVVNSGSLTNAVLEFRNIVSSASSGAFQAVASIFGGFFSFILIFVLSVYFALSETGIDDFIRLVTPTKYQAYALSLWHRSQTKIGLWLKGQLILSLIIGVLGFLWLQIFQVPYALLIAIFAAVIELIPVFGSFISGIIAVVVAASTGGLQLAAIIAVGFIVINLIQSNLIYPLVVKQVIGVPPLLVILALIAGAQLAGVYGVLLSVPLAAVVRELVSDLQKEREKEGKELARAR